jgi:Putative enzyme of poly-gamma-glutamate biosynthesis (capsule formation)
MDIHPRYNNKAKWVFLVVLLILIVAGMTLVIYFRRPNSSTSTLGTSDAQPETIIPPTAVSLESRILFMGNTFWGRYINDWSMASEKKTAYPFSRLSEFNRDSYDAWISGLECPSVAGVDISSQQQEDTLEFNCPPKYLAEAAKWFTAFTLANNHTDNQGTSGFAETKKQLDKSGIQHFGHYDPRKTNEACGIISVKTRIKYDDDSTKNAEIPIVFCGYHGVFMIPPDNSLKEIQKYSKYLPVIAMPHMGAEYKPSADQIKTSTYRTMIDYGAEMVIGDHPHWVQNTEAYNGKLIVYSMGNFMFDQQSKSEVTRSALIDVTLSTESDDIKGWTEIAEECKKDGLSRCIELIESKELKKPVLSYKFDVVGSDNSGKITHKASSAQLESIKQRLNWTATMKGLIEQQHR